MARPTKKVLTIFDSEVDLGYYREGTFVYEVLKASKMMETPISVNDFKHRLIETTTANGVSVKDLANEFLSDFDLEDTVTEALLMTLDLMEQDKLIKVTKGYYTEGPPPVAEILEVQLTRVGRSLYEILFDHLFD